MRTFAEKPKATQQNTSARSTMSHRCHFGHSHEVNSVFNLQRTIGNQAVLRLLQSDTEEHQPAPATAASKRFGQDFSRIPVHAARPETTRIQGHRSSIQDTNGLGLPLTSSRVESGRSLATRSFLPSFTPMAEPVSNGSLDKPEEPFGEFNEEETETMSEAPVSEMEESAPVSHSIEAAATAKAVDVAQPAAASATRTVIRGPREMWNFNGESPPDYLVSARLSTNRRRGAFQWSVSAQLTLSSATAATPTVTTVAPSVPPGRDAWIRVRHTDVGGATTAASYRLTILAPDSLTHLSNFDRAHAIFGYLSEIHYSIHDQFGTVLPRNVPLNEQWTGPSVIDFPGGNWTRSPECGISGVCTGSFNPADWHDLIGGEVDTGAIPAPVGPEHADAGVAADHWPGNWRIGSSTPGNGTLVSSVTWQRNRGLAQHT